MPLGWAIVMGVTLLGSVALTCYALVATFAIPREPLEEPPISKKVKEILRHE